MKELPEKENIVGFIGKLWLVKGVLNFVESMPLILSQHENVKFILIGDGYLRGRVENDIKNFNIEDKVFLTGWIPHDRLPDYFKKIKLLVLPSYTEGVPGVLQEAMASGVVVLATSVGGIPDLLKDKETGFILENNSPECIARNVATALDTPRLDIIAGSARTLLRGNTHTKRQSKDTEVCSKNCVTDKKARLKLF